ncbi:hypothetical protein Tco_0590546 [Tanacetum coccineum]
MPNEIKDQIALALPFKEGTLPVRYLGVPMMTKKLCNINCRVLIDSVRKRIFDWKNKYVSYAGKLQLIASVLSSLNGKKGMTSVAWKDVCRPKSRGRLGLRTMKLMNEALMFKYLWNIMSKKDSLWVKWVNSYRLKGRSVWSMTLNHSTAWSWRSIMKLRDKIIDFVGCKDKLVDWIDNGRWSWRNYFVGKFREVLDVPIHVLTKLDNKILWYNKKYEVVNFSVKEACSALRVDIPDVLWGMY